MKKYFIALLTLLALPWAFAQDTFEMHTQAVARTPKFKADITDVTLDRLLSQESFEGLHFKVVKGKTDEVVTIHDDPAIVLKAATTYYHLNKARDYFVQELKSEFVSQMGTITVRIDIPNHFNELGHFGNDNLAGQFNNALTIPAGAGMPGRGVQPWSTEIWFRPAKRVHVRDLKIKGANSYDGVLRSFRNQMHMSSLQRFISNMVQAATNENVRANYGWEDLIRIVGSSVILEAIYQGADPINRLFSRKWYHLDTALVPEIIYHEFAHVALSDYLVLSHSTSVIEGMADYFAGAIANSSKLATRIKKYNTFSGKKAKRKQVYSVQFETTDYANADFVFGLLWEMKNIVGEETSDRFIYALREKLHTNASVRGQLVEGILQTCDELCANPSIDRVKLLRQLNARGI